MGWRAGDFPLYLSSSPSLQFSQLLFPFFLSEFTCLDELACNLLKEANLTVGGMVSGSRSLAFEFESFPKPSKS